MYNLLYEMHNVLYKSNIMSELKLKILADRAGIDYQKFRAFVTDGRDNLDPDELTRANAVLTDFSSDFSRLKRRVELLIEVDQLKNV